MLVVTGAVMGAIAGGAAVGSGGTSCVAGDAVGPEMIGCVTMTPARTVAGVMIDAVNWPPGVMAVAVGIGVATAVAPVTAGLAGAAPVGGTITLVGFICATAGWAGNGPAV